MKRSATLLVVVTMALILATASCKAAAAGDVAAHVKCGNINPFFNKLVSKISNLELIRGEPKISKENVCGGMWAEKGTCCDLEKLLKHVSKDSKKLTKAAEDLKQNVIKMSSFQKPKHMTLIETSEYLLFLKKLIHVEQKASFLKSLDKCAAYMVEARSSSFCSICSGDSYRYFLNGKAIISMQTCSSMVSNCKDFIEDTSEMLQSMESLASMLISASQNIDPKNRAETKNALRIVQNNNHILEAQPVLMLLQGFQSDMSSESTDIIYSQLCSSFYHLIQPTWIQQFEVMLNLTKSLLIYHMDKIGHVFDSNWYKSLSKAQISKFLKSNPKSQPRSLRRSARERGREREEKDDAFDKPEVVVMRKGDNMFSAYDGVKGSSLDNQFSDTKAMNLKVPFP